jgi:two-component system sensor kinase FixL
MGHVEHIAGGSDRRHAPAPGGLLRFLQRRKTDPSRELDDVRLVLEAMPLAVLLLDDEGRVDMGNAGAARLLGQATDALAGRDIEGLIADGSHASLDVQASALHLHGREWRLVFLTDIGERNRRDTESARQRDEVAHLSRVAMLGELSGALAHELNQPLAAILCNAQAAQRVLHQRGDDDADADAMLRDILADIVSDDRRAGEIIQRLRKWLRKEHAEHAPLAVGDVVLDALHLVRADLLHRDIDVHVDIAGQLPRVQGDRILLQQVLLNFVLNGCESMDGLPLPRLLRVRACEAAGGGVRIEVTDHGRGIASDILAKMFEPFETTKPGGMGMGLAVCRTIVESHGGRIFSRNMASGGACVGFELPARVSRAP